MVIAAAALLLSSLSFAADVPRLRIVTSSGNIIIELMPDRAPLTVANFLKYVDAGHFKDTLFHRVITNFVIQGGGYATDYRELAAPDKVVNESGNGLSNVRGGVGLARTENPHSGDCQFYINLVDNPVLDPSAARWGYAVFGKVVDGMEVVDQIGHVATGAAGPFKNDAPLKPVVIERIERITP
jgi:peptidyl-prolyl cis-trans isomerase A (cyclophilin A)